MNQTMKVVVHPPWDKLLGQAESLTIAKSEEFRQTLAALLLSRIDRIDRIRIYSPGAGKHGAVREIAIPAGGRNRAVLDLYRAVFDQKGLKIDDPEISVALTLDENGTISFGVEGGEAVVGEDLSVLKSDAHIEGSCNELDIPKTEEFVSAQGIANQIGVDKATIIRRIKNNRLIGYQGFKRDWLIPRAQFKDRDVVPGIAEMIALFGNDHREAWFFLSSGFFYGDDNPRPIDRLRAVKRSDEAGLKACLKELESVKGSYDHGDHF